MEAAPLWAPRKTLAESRGFEPRRRLRRLHDFQSCAFDHSANSPVKCADYSSVKLLASTREFSRFMTALLRPRKTTTSCVRAQHEDHNAWHAQDVWEEPSCQRSRRFSPKAPMHCCFPPGSSSPPWSWGRSLARSWQSTASSTSRAAWPSRSSAAWAAGSSETSSCRRATSTCSTPRRRSCCASSLASSSFTSPSRSRACPTPSSGPTSSRLGCSARQA